MESFVNNGLNGGGDADEEKELRIYVNGREAQKGATFKLDKLFFAETEMQGKFFAAKATIKKGEVNGSAKVAGTYSSITAKKGDAISVFVDANDPVGPKGKAKARHGFNTLVQILSSVSGITAAEIVRNTQDNPDYILELCADEEAFAGKEFTLLPANTPNEKGWYDIVYG